MVLGAPATVLLFVRADADPAVHTLEMLNGGINAIQSEFERRNGYFP